MSSINRKIKRRKTNSMVDEYVEATMTSILSDKKEDITYCSYNKDFIRDSKDLRIKFSIHFTKLIFTAMGRGEYISTYSNFLEKCISSIDTNQTTKLFNYTIDNDKIIYKNELVGFNLGKILINNFIIYFAGQKLFFKDTKTNKKYMYLEEIKSKEVA